MAALGLDRTFTSPLFLAVVALAAGSLLVVVWEQWGRLRREWATPREAAFRSAPFRRELERPASGAPRGARITTRGRLGDLGSPLFHVGLLVVTLAGVVRMLLGADAASDVVERNQLGAGPGAFETQDRGLLAGPVELPWPLQVVALEPTYYPTGSLLGLSAQLELQGGPGRVELAINAPAQIGDTKVFLTQQFGPAVVLETARPNGPEVRAALLAFGAGSDYELATFLPDGRELRLRAPYEAGAARPPQVVDVRVLSGSTLMAAGRLPPGGTLRLPDGQAITLREVRWWVRLVAARDPSTWPAYLGFGVAVLGVILMFGLIRTDELVVVEPAQSATGEVARERVVVALRARRLAPLFAERFEAMVRREQGGGRKDGG